MVELFKIDLCKINNKPAYDEIVAKSNYKRSLDLCFNEFVNENNIIFPDAIEYVGKEGKFSVQYRNNPPVYGVSTRDF